MADDSGIDPRYAAQFQRGYDPARHRAAPPPAPAVSAAPPRLPGGPVSHAERVPDAPAPRRMTPPIPPLTEDAGDEPVEAVESDRRGFRVEWILPALGAALLVAAGLILGTARELIGGRGPADYVDFLTLSTVPGPLVVAATVCFTAWLMLRALRSGAP